MASTNCLDIFNDHSQKMDEGVPTFDIGKLLLANMYQATRVYPNSMIKLKPYLSWSLIYAFNEYVWT